MANRQRPGVRAGQPFRWLALAAACALVAVTGILLTACSSLGGRAVSAPEITGASFVGNTACMECHTNYVRAFAGNPHARVQVTGAPPELRREAGCESCHGPGSRHIAAGGGRGRFIVNPRRNPDACFECHSNARAEFHLPHHHPVIEGRMNCVQCHDPHGSDALHPVGSGGLAMARLNESCAECHREQVRPFVFEHEALREGCTVCHSPHGSPNRKMLAQPDANLCLRCHAQVQGADVAAGEFFIGKVPHAGVMSSGSCWAAGCHTAVHGSSIHPRLLF